MMLRLVRGALFVIAVVLIGVLLLGAGATPQVIADVAVGNNAVIYLYDPDTSQYIYTFDLVSQYSGVSDIVVYNNGGVYEVWFTIQDGDQIARLDYTNPSTTDLTTYSLPAGSGPLNLSYHNGVVWFTAPGGNYVGKLDPATGDVTQVVLPTENSFPADLDVAGDGSIWFTEYNTGNLGHITGAGPYVLDEVEKSAWSGGNPFGIAVSGSGDVYFAQTAMDQVMYYLPGSDVGVAITFLDRPNHPYRMVMDNMGRAWGTVLGGNAIAMFAFDTLPIVNQYSLTPDASYPVAIDVDSNNVLWYAQKFGNQIGSLDASDLNASTNPVAMPNAEDVPVGIAVDDLDRVWVLAQSDTLVDVYLPVNNWQSSTSP